MAKFMAHKWFPRLLMSASEVSVEGAGALHLAIARNYRPIIDVLLPEEVDGQMQSNLNL